MENNDKIRGSYNKLAGNYDTFLSVKKTWVKIACKIIWGFKDTEYTEELLTWLPDDFWGKLLDIPVGTALFTVEKYKIMKNADIICMDYSKEMMEKASEKFIQNGLNSIKCIQGDIGNLPFEHETFDLILSMNGFHVFPNKEKAYEEVNRVLKTGGIFIGCFYVKGEIKRTDWFIRNFYAPKKYFTPPFQNISEVKNELEKYYHIEKIKTMGSIVYFKCIKK